MFEAFQTSTPREKTRAPTLADAFVEVWPNPLRAEALSSVRLILEVNEQIAGLVGYDAVQLDVHRDRDGYDPAGCTFPTPDPNAIWLRELRIPRGIRVDQVRSLLRIARLAAMEHGFEWVGCELAGQGWQERASLARWRTDQEPALWLFWRESFVDVSKDGLLKMLWRNPAF